MTGSLQYLYQVKVQKDAFEQRLVWGAYLGSFLMALSLAALIGKPSLILPVTALLSVLIAPTVRAFADTGLLQSLIAGGCFEEIRQTSVTSGEVVDSLVVCGLRRQAQTAATPFMVGMAMALASSIVYETPNYLIGAWIWAAVNACLTVLLTYLFVAQLAHRYGGQQLDPTTAALFLMGSAVPGVQLVKSFGEQPASPAWPIYLIAMLGCLVACIRQVAIDGLKFAERTNTTQAGSPASPRAQREFRVRPWSDNPIVARECARELGHLKDGWFGYLAHCWGLGLAFALTWFVIFWEVNLFARSYEGHWTGAWWLLGLALLLAGRAGSRIHGALKDERDKKTLEILVVSPLKSEDFVDGWAQVGYVPRLRELTLCTVLCLAACILVYRDPRMVVEFLGAYVCGAMLIRSGAFFQLGLGMRACSRKRSLFDTVLSLGVIFTLMFLLVALAVSKIGFAIAFLLFASFVEETGRKLALSTVGE